MTEDIAGMKLTKGEKQMLDELVEWGGKLSIDWWVKTREQLVLKGLVRVDGDRVSITLAGMAVRYGEHLQGPKA